MYEPVVMGSPACRGVWCVVWWGRGFKGCVTFFLLQFSKSRVEGCTFRGHSFFFRLSHRPFSGELFGSYLRQVPLLGCVWVSGYHRLQDHCRDRHYCPSGKTNFFTVSPRYGNVWNSRSISLRAKTAREAGPETEAILLTSCRCGTVMVTLKRFSSSFSLALPLPMMRGNILLGTSRSNCTIWSRSHSCRPRSSRPRPRSYAGSSPRRALRSLSRSLRSFAGCRSRWSRE